MKINKDKSIGTCIFIVEGSSTEFNLLKRIFCYILKYEYVAKTRESLDCFKSKNYSHSKIYVVNTRNSNIKSIKDKDYLDATYEYLINNFDLDLDNAAKFYIFDRDLESNTDVQLIAHFIDELTDPYDDESEFGNGGMLILSYPAIESYMFSNFLENSHHLEKRLGSEVKILMGKEEYSKSVQLNKLSEETLLFACKELFNYLKENNILYDIENYKNVNKSVFEIQENYFNLNKTYRLISLLSCAFLQLGIIELDE